MKAESLGEMDPMLPPGGDAELSDLAVDLIQRSAALAAPITAPVQAELGPLVRSMNCYYSNFIEGHQTHPRDIERALARDFDGNQRQRDLQKEAVAHIAVQKAIDSSKGVPDAWPTSEAYVRWVHRAFCEQ